MPDASTLHGPILDAARRFPSRTALTLGGRAWSYARLARESAALAARLRADGVGPGSRVLVQGGRAPETVAALLACLRAGAACVPADPRNPPARVRELLEDALGAPVQPAPQDAYVLYTSGSTGRPKGVAVTHAAARAFADWALRTLRLRPSDRLAAVSSFQFDLSTLDLWAGLAAGARVDLLPDGAESFPGALVRFLRARRSTVLYGVPTLYAAALDRGGLAPGALPDLRLALFAGEPMPPRVLSAWRAAAPRAELWNLYGPTETNVCCAWRAPRGWREPDGVPIGRAAAGARLSVVDRRGRPAREGELVVAGPAVMRGYLGGPPAGGAHHTGDRVRLGADGLLRFLGRGDRQAKLGGYRVEPGEVEAALLAHPGVRAAAALAGPRGLRAFAAADVPEAALRRHLAERLPPWLLPRSLSVRRRLPSLVSGKVDRRALAREAGA